MIVELDVVGAGFYFSIFFGRQDFSAKEPRPLTATRSPLRSLFRQQLAADSFVALNSNIYLIYFKL